MQMNNLKSYLLFGVGVTALWLALKPDNQYIELVSLKNKLVPLKKKKRLPIEKGGYPDPLDVEDNKMVSEGSMYSVNYFNETQQK